jgi:hypothetical protein
VSVFARFSLLVAVILGSLAIGWAQEVSIAKVEEQPLFTIENAAVNGLSGIVWTGGDQFYVVSDHPAQLVPLTLKIDRATGRIESGEIGAPMAVKAAASDFEGVAYVAATKTFYISAETGNAVVSFKPGGAAQLQPVPSVYAQARKNLSLESITWNDRDAHFWIANEEALLPDGPLSGAQGTLVRLQQLDAKFRPVAQYAWRTEPAGMRFHNTGNGVSDLCLLPDGKLIVLERGFGFGGLHLRLFLADFKGATDTSKMPALADADIMPAGKVLLFEQATGLINFEGIALGPKLDDGSWSLILIADSNGGSAHAFLPLTLRVGAPATSAKAGAHPLTPKATPTR